LPQGAVAARYQALVAERDMHHDGAQVALISRLDALCTLLQQREETVKTGLFELKIQQLWRRKNAVKTEPRGLYIHGAVGRGKTMLMDLFFDCLPLKQKKRAHFNDFMNDVQNRLHIERERLRKSRHKKTDPIPPIAAQLAREARVLCFDEFSVTDIADAMILGRLFTALFDAGVMLVATSNVAPDDLYRQGLNRALFLPFIDILKHHVDVFNLDTPTDYRLEKTAGEQSYFFPLSRQTRAQMDMLWEEVTKNTPVRQDIITVRGHDIIIEHAAGKAVRFHFRDLCAKPLAAYDYIALAQKYDLFFIDEVPVFDHAMRNEAKRFILLIDTLYEAHAKLVMSAAAAPNALYGETSTIKTTESFEFDRTASRLFDMQSTSYLFFSVKLDVYVSLW